MSLAQVVLPPPTGLQGLEEWAFAHYQHHLAIAEATKRNKNVTIPIPQIYPLSLGTIQNWLENHQTLHNEMNAVLRVQGNDLSTLNWNDERQREGFFWLNYMEHKSAEANAGP